MFDNKLFKDCYLNYFWRIKSVNIFVEIEDEKGEISYINQNNFLEFIFKNKININNNSFNYDCVVNNKKELSTKEVFDKWNKEYNKNDKDKIDYDSLKVGYVYQLDSKNDYLVYLGKKWVIQWKFNKITKKIELSKPKQERIAYVTYKHNQFDMNLLSSKNKKVLKKQVLIKEVGVYKNKYSTEDVLFFLKNDLHYLYLDEKKPLDNLKVGFKEIDKEYLQGLSKKGITFTTVFHESNGYYILNNYGVYSDLFDFKAEIFQRQVSLSKHNEIIFKFEGSSLIANQDEKSYLSYNNKLCELTTKCQNDNYRIVPDNYNILILEQD